MGKFREHGVMLFLSPELYVGFIKLQADRGLGRSYAGLLPFTEGLYQMGYVSKEVYEEHVKRYSKPLVSEKSKPSTKQQLKEQRQIEQLNKTLDMVADQWEDHPSEEWREKWLKIAVEHSELAAAKEVLALASEKVVSE